MKQVKAHKDAVSGASRRSVEQWLRSMPNCTFYHGSARFRSPQEVNVGADLLTAPRIFLNVGTRPRIPAMPGLDQVDYLTNSSMMDVDFLPPHLLIVGGSYHRVFRIEDGMRAKR